MRIAIFTDYDNTATLIEATLSEATRRSGAEVVAVFTSDPALARRRSRARSLRRMTGALVRRRRLGRAGRVAELCRRFGVPLVVVPGGNPNDPEFLDELGRRWRPDVALSYWSLTIFRADWLATFDVAVNFHDGHIPDHRGVGATTMEVYEGLDTGGFTFHHIDLGIDTGNVLVEGSVPIDGIAMMDIVEAKLVAAGRMVADVLDRIERRDPGRPQQGEGTYTSGRAMAALGRIEDPGSLDRAEVERRIAALGAVALPVAGHPRPVTALSRRRAWGRPRIDLADGPVWLCRIDGLPPPLHRAGRALRRLRR